MCSPREWCLLNLTSHWGHKRVNNICYIFLLIPKLTLYDFCNNILFIQNFAWTFFLFRQALANRCFNLEELNLNSCNQILRSLEYPLQKLNALRVLDLNFTKLVDPIMYLPEYEELQSSRCRWFSKLNQLRRLCFMSSNWVTDELLDGISQSCPYLEVLDLRCFFETSHITDTGLIHLCRLQHLVDLNLSLCQDVTDVGVKSLAKQGRLEVLQLFACREITDESVIELAECCLNLRKLDLSRCFNITAASVMAFYNNANKKSTPLELIVKETDVCVNKRKVAHPMLKIM